MIHIKSILILYLIISSFPLSICSTTADEKDENILFTVPKEVLEKIKNYSPEIVSAYHAKSIIGGIDKIITTIGKGIMYASSSIYSAILETCGTYIAGAVVVSTWLVVFTATGYIIYKVANSNHYIKIGEFEYSSSEEEEKSKK